MAARSRITFCPEGWVYLLILSVLMTASIIREINLLVVLAGMMLGPLLISWRLSSLMVRSLTVRRGVPDRLSAGDLSQVDVALSNQRRRLGGWAMTIRDQLVREGDEAAAPTLVQVMLPFVGAGRTEHAAYRVLLGRRGRYQFGPLQISTRFPLGLVQASVRSDNRETLIVLPKLGRLTHRWSLTIDAERLAGSRSQRRRGTMEGDFHGLREWRPGDSKRWIHWRTSARLDCLTVREFEQTANRDAAMVVDLWQPSHPTEADRENVETAVSVAATVAADLIRRRAGRLLLAIAADQPQRWSASHASSLLQQEVLNQLAVAKACDGQSLTPLLEACTRELRRDARLVVVSTRGQGAWRDQSQWQGPDGIQSRRILEQVIWLDVASPELSLYYQASS